MKFKTLNTKDRNEYIYSESEIRQLFEDNRNLIAEKIIEKRDYDYVLENPLEFFDEETVEEEKANFIKHWHSDYREILEGKEYLKELIEAETWTSPRGIEPVFRLIEVID